MTVLGSKIFVAVRLFFLEGTEELSKSEGVFRMGSVSSRGVVMSRSASKMESRTCFVSDVSEFDSEFDVLVRSNSSVRTSAMERFFAFVTLLRTRSFFVELAMLILRFIRRLREIDSSLLRRLERCC